MCIHACPTILDYDGRNVGTRREVFKLASFTSITDICSRSNAATFLGVGLDHVMMLMAETAKEIWDDLKHIVIRIMRQYCSLHFAIFSFVICVLVFNHLEQKEWSIL